MCVYFDSAKNFLLLVGECAEKFFHESASQHSPQKKKQREQRKRTRVIVARVGGMKQMRTGVDRDAFERRLPLAIHAGIFSWLCADDWARLARASRQLRGASCVPAARIHELVVNCHYHTDRLPWILTQQPVSLIIQWADWSGGAVVAALLANAGFLGRLRRLAVSANGDAFPPDVAYHKQLGRQITHLVITADNANSLQTSYDGCYATAPRRVGVSLGALGRFATFESLRALTVQYAALCAAHTAALVRRLPQGIVCLELLYSDLEKGRTESAAATQRRTRHAWPREVWPCPMTRSHEPLPLNFSYSYRIEPYAGVDTLDRHARAELWTACGALRQLRILELPLTLHISGRESDIGGTAVFVNLQVLRLRALVDAKVATEPIAEAADTRRPVAPTFPALRQLFLRYGTPCRARYVGDAQLKTRPSHCPTLFEPSQLQPLPSAHFSPLTRVCLIDS
jgi:hypothetical protein